MSTYIEAIERADRNRPNAFDISEKMRWLAALEGKLALDVFQMSIDEAAEIGKKADDPDAELRVKFPHDEIYVLYLEAKIDQENGEYNKYANELEVYNAALGEFVRWFGRVYLPAQGYRESKCASCTTKPPYYMSNYALACAEGYTGTLTEWLESLKGSDAYLHIKYSATEPTSDDDMKDTPDEWMGVLADHTETASGTYTDYIWYHITGSISVNSVNGYTGTVTLTATDVGAAAESHSHDAATTTAAGFLSADDKTKLDGIAEGATSDSITVTPALTSGTEVATVSVNGTESKLYCKTPTTYTAGQGLTLSGTQFKMNAATYVTAAPEAGVLLSYGTADPSEWTGTAGQIYIKITEDETETVSE